jgi:hypothetical protein
MESRGESVSLSASLLRDATCQLQEPETWNNWSDKNKSLPILVGNLPKFDLDNDGKIELYEFVSKDALTFMQVAEETGLKDDWIAKRSKQSSYDSFVKELRTNFNSFDTNHDGTISNSELEHSMQRIDLNLSQAVNAKFLEDRFGDFSALNKDKGVTRESINLADRVVHDKDWLFMPHFTRFSSSTSKEHEMAMWEGVLWTSIGGTVASLASKPVMALMTTSGLGGVAIGLGTAAVGAALGAGALYVSDKHESYKHLRERFLAPAELPAERRW